MKKLIYILFIQFAFFGLKAQEWKKIGEFDEGVFVHADTSGNQLYARGAFTKVDSNNIYKLARWDNNQWKSLGFGID